MRRDRGFATLLVLAVVAIAGVTIAALQASSLDDAMEGRLALARVRAHWAARAGVEATVAKLEFNAVNPSNDFDAYLDLDEMAEVAEGTLGGGIGRDPAAIYRVSTFEGGKEMLGPLDAHSRLNINLAGRESLMELPLVTEDVVDGVLDWIDGDEDVTLLGAEAPQYMSQAYPYEPRNAPMRTIQEMELVTGVQTAVMRGEDWNLNNVLDASERDGTETWPIDSGDASLDTGWAGLLTASSTDDVLDSSGQAKLVLKTASAGDISKVVGCQTDQAQAIADYVAGNENAILGDFIRQDLRQLVESVGKQDRPQALSREHLGTLLNECVIEAPTTPKPGRLNINTASLNVLELVFGLDTGLADAVVAARAGKAKGFESIAELLDIEGLSRRMVAELEPRLTVRSNVYELTSRGRDAATGLEVEIVATIDRSTVPVVIKELRIR